MRTQSNRFALPLYAVYALRFIGLLAGLISYIILSAGVASTVFDWVPQPSMEAVIAAFQIVAGLAALFIVLVALITIVFGVSEPIIFIYFGLIAVAIAPVVFLLYHASITVWEALPEVYDVQASFLFIVATVIVGTFRYFSTGDDSESD